MRDHIDIVVIGAGSAGLTAAYTMKALGLVPFEDFIVMDAETAPGGSWQRGWDFATIGRSAEVVELPGMTELGLEYRRLDPDTPTRDAVPMFRRRYEDAYELFVMRPAKVERVEAIPRESTLRIHYQLGSGPMLLTRTLRARLIVNATGHWGSPFVPWVPGTRDFRGPQRHVATLESLDEFRGTRPLVIGGGRSALAVLRRLERIAPDTLWSTRRAPDFIEPPRIGLRAGRTTPSSEEARARADALIERGAAFPSDVSLSGIPLTRGIRDLVASGFLSSRGPIERLLPGAVRFADGAEEPIDSILWATGFRETVRHLAPLHLREAGGTARIRDGWSHKDRRIAFVGYGPGRSPQEALEDAVRLAEQLIERLGELPPAERAPRRWEREEWVRDANVELTRDSR